VKSKQEEAKLKKGADFLLKNLGRRMWIKIICGATTLLALQSQKEIIAQEVHIFTC